MGIDGTRPGLSSVQHPQPVLPYSLSTLLLGGSQQGVAQICRPSKLLPVSGGLLKRSHTRNTPFSRRVFGRRSINSSRSTRNVQLVSLSTSTTVSPRLAATNQRSTTTRSPCPLVTSQRTPIGSVMCGDHTQSYQS